MSRVVQPILALVLFVGVGFASRHFYREWITATIKEAQEARRKRPNGRPWKPTSVM
ncbi:MAG: hypothetical protein ACJ8C4_18265 [Gemmataceae bacterium]